MKMLLLEDNQADAQLQLRTINALYPSGQCDLAACLGDALTFLAKTSYVAILTDLNLPDAGNLEVLDALRAAAPLTPIIVMTGINDRTVTDAALARGAQDYLVKGTIESQALERSIRHAVQRQQALNEKTCLLDELQQARQLLSRKNTRLKRLYRTAQEFVDHVSHEFRTPLSVIKEYASLIHDGIVGPVEKEQRQLLKIIDDRADDLNIMVDDMLDVSKLNAGLLGAWRKEACVGEIIQRISPVLERKAAARKVTLRAHIDSDLPVVYCDGEKVGRVIINLVVNAIKYCGEAGKVELWASHDPAAMEVRIGVTDNGPWISPEDLKKIFRRFSQLDRGLRNGRDGFGLGLSIVNELVDANFGTIDVSSQPEQGNTFSFTVPLANPRHVVVKYLQRLQKRHGGALRISLIRARVERCLDPSLAEAMDSFFYYILRRHDLLFRVSPNEWMLLVASSELEIGSFLQRAAEALADANRNRPFAELPKVQYEHLGSWSCGKGRDAILASIDRYCVHMPQASRELSGSAV